MSIAALIWLHPRLDDTLVHLAGIFHNLYMKIEELETVFYKGDNGWKFYIHYPGELPTLGVQTHAHSIYAGQGRDLRLDLKVVGFFIAVNFL